MRTTAPIASRGGGDTTKGTSLAVTVHVTSVIRKVVDDQKQLAAEGGTIGELLEHIEQRYPGFRQQVSDDAGELHRFVNIYVNDEDIRYLDGTDTAVSDGDSVSILPALAGG
jgi:molybdopterin synthase sulfur carrier subunit